MNSNFGMFNYAECLKEKCFYRENIEFSHFYNLNYRGVAVLQIKQKFRIPDTDIVSINAYNYTTDFKAYMDLFTK